MESDGGARRFQLDDGTALPTPANDPICVFEQVTPDDIQPVARYPQPEEGPASCL